MILSTIIIVAVFVFFAIISMVYFIGWRSFRDDSVLGGVILMWATLVILFLIIFFVRKN